MRTLAFRLGSWLAVLLAGLLLSGVTAGDALGAKRNPASPGGAAPIVADLLRDLPLAFEPNRGQADAQVKFVARGAGYRILLTAQEAVLALGADKNSWLRIRPLGANRAPVISALEELPGKSNYLDGATPSNWHTNIPNYARVLYQGVYPGIALAYYGKEGKLEYDWVVQPGADPGAIRLSFPGARRVWSRGGELVIKTVAGEVWNRQPVAYQDIAGTRRYVAASYVLDRRQRAGFSLGPYDRSAPLVIDPAIVYLKTASSLVGNGADGIMRPLLDPAGNIYLRLTGFEYPSYTSRVYWLVKLDASGGTIFSTQLGFLGPTATATGVWAVDSAGAVYLTGISGAGLQTTAGAFQPNLRGQTNAFVAKLNPSGSGLLYSTWLLSRKCSAA